MKTSRYLIQAALGLAFAISICAQPADIRQGLISYWPLDVDNGGTTPDGASGNTMSVFSAVGSAGQVGNSFTFNGSSSYLLNVHGSDNAATGLPIYRAGSYTITMWVKGAAQTAKYLFAEGNNSGANQNVLLILQTGQAAANNAKLDVIIRNDTGGTGNIPVDHRVSTTVVFDNTWHHIAWVDDRGTVRLYVDGNLDPANFSYTPVGTYTFTTTAIGALVRSAVGGYFNGQIDDIAVWERPLSQSEVQQIRTNSTALLMTPVPTLAPYLFVQPASSTRYVGDRITLLGRAVGQRPSPLTYQWFKNGAAITDATNNSLSMANLTPADSGDFTLVVTNLNGAVTSVVATLTVPADPPVNIAQGLVSWWPMEVINSDGAGPFTPDPYSHNDMRLTNMDAGNLLAGSLGNAATFNGTDEFGARAGGFPIYNNPAYSIALWVNATGTGQSDKRFFSESSTLNTFPLFNLGTDATGANGTIRVYIRNDANTVLLASNSTRVALDGTWHHVVWTETNGQARLYIDGVLDESTFNYTRGALTMNQTTLGAILRSTLGNYFSGMLDDVAVWNRLLSFAEIQAIRTGGIPAPVMALPPTITQHPTSRSLYTQAKTTFSFLATGTSPLAIQWRKGGSDLVDETNQTLVLNNLTLSDAGNYDVVVTNSVGGATSMVATLTVTLRPPPPAAFAVDINNLSPDDVPANTEAGFSSFSIPEFGIGPFTRSFGGADVTLTAIGTTMESRKRATPVNAPPFTEEKLLQDFVFTRDATTAQGLDVAVEFLEPNKPYRIGIWSFDTTSTTPARVSDWTANGVTVTNGYSFVGTALPVDNATYRFNFDSTSDANGKILIQGRRSASATGSLNVFLNAIKLEKLELRIIGIEYPTPFDITLVVQKVNPAASHFLVKKTSLSDPEWLDEVNATYENLAGGIVKITFQRPEGPAQFYSILQINP
jgi:hypothetical protein